MQRRFSLPALFSTAGFLALVLALLLYPQAVQSSVSSSILYCLTVLTPSLFPFMALTSYAVNSPAASFLGRPLDTLTRYIFRLPGCCAVPILMSFIGGYPAGAKGASLLLSEGRITQKQAGRMLLFCVNPGLAFTVTFLGTGVFSSPMLGWQMFASVTLSAVLLGIITGLGTPIPPRRLEPPLTAQPAQALTRSVSDAARSVLIMCACIVLFSGFTAILHSSGVYQTIVKLLTRTRLFSPQEWASVLSFLLEVTGGTGDATALGVGPAFFAFGLAFGGICVHLQVFSLFRELPARIPVFLLCRTVHGLLAAGCFIVINHILPGGTVPAMVGMSQIGTAAFSGSWMGGASLLLMSSAFLLITGGKDRKTQ